MKVEQEILAIEDDPEDYLLLERIVSKSSDLHISQLPTLSQAMVELAEKPVALVLLDLTLPDSKGIDAITTLIRAHDIPVVVLTGIANEDMAYKAVQLGAQDYLVKGTFDSALLIKTIRYAIERYRLVHELNESKLAVQRAQDQQRLQSSIPAVIPSVTASSFGQYSLKESRPDLFDEFVNRYTSVLREAMEERAFKVDNGVPLKLRSLATQLGKQRVAPHDVVELHTTTLTSITKNASAGKSDVFNQEGRFLLIGILGHLCTFYRNYCYSLLPSPSIGSDVDDLKNHGSRST